MSIQQCIRFRKPSFAKSSLKTTSSTQNSTLKSQTYSYIAIQLENFKNQKVNQLSEKFNELNQNYQIDTNKSNLGFEEEGKHGRTKSVPRMNKFNLAESLKHLENIEELLMIDQEMAKRRNRNRIFYKKQLNSRKKIDLSYELDEPYLLKYKQFLKEVNSKTSAAHLTEDLSSSSSSDEGWLEGGKKQEQITVGYQIQYLEKLKPYRPILKYTKQRHDDSKQRAAAEINQEKRNKTLLQIRKNTNPLIVKQYEREVEHYQNAYPSKTMYQTKKQINKRIERLLKKKDAIPTGQIEARSERCQKFMLQQNKVLEQSQLLCNRSMSLMEKKFHDLAMEIEKGDKRGGKRMRPQSVSVPARKPSNYRR